jgi:hypothetical protein
LWRLSNPMIGNWVWENSLADGCPYPIGRTEIEKNDGIPKSVDHPDKSCGEKLSGDQYRRWILIRLLNRIRHNFCFFSCWSGPKGRPAISCKNVMITLFSRQKADGF